MKRRILIVDDEVAVLLTMKAILEIGGFEVHTAASAREALHQLRARQYDMVITDMRMESEQAGREVIAAARNAPHPPAIALLTAFPVDEADWQDLHADKLLLKPVHTRLLLDQIESLFESHQRKLKSGPSKSIAAPKPGKAKLTKATASQTAAPKPAVKKSTRAAAKSKPTAKAKPATRTTSASAKKLSSPRTTKT